MAHLMNKFNAAGLRPERSMNLPTRAASEDEEHIMHTLMHIKTVSDEDIAGVFAPELIYTAPNGQVFVGIMSVISKLRELAYPDACHLLETPSALPQNVMVMDMHMPTGARHLVVLKRRAKDGLVSTMTNEEGHCKTLAPQHAAHILNGATQSPTDMMMSPCTSKLNLVKRRHLMKAKPTNLFAGMINQPTM